jgi:hypothetical protein
MTLALTPEAKIPPLLVEFRGGPMDGKRFEVRRPPPKEIKCPHELPRSYTEVDLASGAASFATADRLPRVHRYSLRQNVFDLPDGFRTMFYYVWEGD